jgi:3-hydroxyisobutyrate dehydrogenase-like beta-hydroxyacid dehydrogenase
VGGIEGSHMSDKDIKRDMRIGWIGLGKMGAPITDNLLEAGFNLTVFDADIERIRLQERRGAHGASSVAEVARNTDVIFSIIPDDAALRHIALGVGGVIANALPDAIYIDMSTVSPTISEIVRDTALTQRLGYIAAPVSGSTILAERRELTVFASGPANCYQKVKPLFDAISSKQYYVGGDQQARYLKLAINHLVGSTAVMLGEALTLGRKGGLDWKLMLDVIGDSVIASPLIKYKLDLLKERNFTAAFTVRQMLKDMTLVVEAGVHAGVEMATALLVMNKFAEYASDGGADLDFFSILQAVEARAKLV